jgi:hypothetical protein
VDGAGAGVPPLPLDFEHAAARVAVAARTTTGHEEMRDMRNAYYGAVKT